MLFRNLILSAAFVTASVASASSDGRHEECLAYNAISDGCGYAVCVPTISGGTMNISIKDRDW